MKGKKGRKNREKENILIVGKSNSLLIVNVSSRGHKIRKKIEDINFMLTFKVDLIDMNQTQYLENRHDNFFSRAHGIFTKIITFYK